MKKIVLNLTAEPLIKRMEALHTATGLPYSSILINALNAYLEPLPVPDEPAAKPKRRPKPFSPPVIDEVADYFRSRGLMHPTREAKSWMEYYQGRGWKWGTGAGRAIKSWKAVAAQWARGKELGKSDGEPVDFDDEPSDLGLG